MSSFPHGGGYLRLYPAYLKSVPASPASIGGAGGILDKPFPIKYNNESQLLGSMILKKENQEAISYTVEREFLGNITVEELLNRIIRAHITPPGQTEEREEGHS